MVWTGSFLTNSTYAFLGVDGYLGLGAFAGGGTPGIGVSVPMFDETAPPPSSTTAVLRDPLWQGRVTITGTGLTFGTSPVQGGGMAPVLTGGTVNTLTFEYNETRAFLIEAASSDPNFIPDNYGTEANFLAALASTENAAHLNPNGVINTGGISGAALGAVQTQLFANNDFQAMLDFFSLFGFAFTGSGQENEFVGTENSDSFFSGGGVDFVDGKGGNDFIDGGAGADNLYGGFGNDTVLGGAGDDLFLFGDRLTFTETDARNGNDIVDGGAGNDTAFGGGGNDLLIGGTGNDSLSGDAGNDTLDGGAGEDVLDGGGIITPEFDVASYQSATAGVTVDLNFFPGQPEYQGAGDAFGDIFLRIEGIIGSEFADTILGFNSVPLSDPNATTNDSLIGGGGNDLIQGFSGSDHIAGGTGNDVIIGGNQIAPGPAEVDVLFYTATQAQTTLIGFSNGILVITPTEGMDFVSGVEAFDFNGTRVATQNLNFDPRPTSFGNAGNNTLTLSSGSEIYVGSNGVDSIVALAGDDVLLGGGGFDILSLGAGDDDARGDAGNDSIGGDAGNDRLYGDGGDDTLDGGSGNDRAEGGAGNDLLYGRGGSDVLIGDEGDDQLVGSGGNDLLIGGFGDDILNGGAGIDSHVGGAGIDTLVLLDVSEATVIDFEAGTATFGATTEFFSGIEGVRLGSGNDFVEGTPEANTVDGGAGSDTVSYAGASAAISLDLFQPATNSGEAAGDSIMNVETIVGSSFGDTIRGWSSVDILQGRAGNDTLVGRGRVDSLEGAAGDDVLLGGPGDDVLTGGHGADFLRGDAGIDRALFVDAPSAVTVDLVAFDNNTGQATGDRYFLIENVDGSDFHDDLRGDAVGNHLRGRDGNDTLRGRGGDDTLEGGRGADRLLGQGGADLFLFSGPAQGIDTIDDFVSGTDRLGFTSAGFGGLPVGALAPARFTTAGVAGDANDRFIYDTGNGRLFYDSDGTGPASARLLVVLAGAPTLTAGDLEIV